MGKGALWIEFSPEGNSIRLWTRNEHQAIEEIQEGRKLEVFYPAETSRLRDALAALVGSGDVDELRGMERAVRELPVPDEDKAVTINAIHALIATAPGEEDVGGNQSSMGCQCGLTPRIELPAIFAGQLG